jgi:glycosyltransferase involved in cell wall biosynthesis
MSVHTPEISVVAPLWNEHSNVLPLAESVFKALGAMPGGIELILVDDASTDGTWEKIIEAQRADRRVRPLRLVRHSGQSAALWAGSRPAAAR